MWFESRRLSGLLLFSNIFVHLLTATFKSESIYFMFQGCRSASFNLEGRSLTSWSTSRHCVVARVQDITIDQFMEIRSKAGALLLVLPKNDTVLSNEEKEVCILSTQYTASLRIS